MAIAGCATTGPAQPAAQTAVSNLATTPNAPVVASEAQGPSDRDKVSCKRTVVTGSRVGKSVCHTEEQWAAIDKQAKEVVNDLNSKAAYQGRAQ